MSLDKVKLVKLRKVKTPTRGTSVSAGLDFYIPDDIDSNKIKYFYPITDEPYYHYESNNDITIHPKESILIPSGIKVNVPHGYCLEFKNRSGLASKKSLIFGAHVVDEDYTGEIFFNIHNIGEYAVTLHPGDKIIQGVFHQVEYPLVEVVDTEEELFKDKETERGAGGFGSTGSN